MKAVIFGARGQLGSELLRRMTGEEAAQEVPHTTWPPAALPPSWGSAVGLGSSEADVRDERAVREAIVRHKPDWVINATAYNFVDRAETDVAAAFAINAFAVRNLARACGEGIPFVHVSTNFVFDGRKRRAYRESDTPRPLSVYGLSKFAGELFASRHARRHLIVRTCGLYGHAPSENAKKNFVQTMLNLGRVNQEVRVVRDQICAPTHCGDLAGAILELLKTRRSGLYHATNSGQCSWAEFSREIFRIAGLKVRVRPITSRAYDAPAERPAYSILSMARLRSAGIRPLRPWKAALAEYVRELEGGSGKS